MTINSLKNDVSNSTMASTSSPTSLQDTASIKLALSEIHTLIQNELIIGKSLVNTNSGKVIYFGTGLCTSREMSQGLPFDFIAMLTTAEKIKRTLNLDKIIHFIADSHAKTNSFCIGTEIDRLASEQRDVINRACKNLGIADHYQIVLASEIDSSQEYIELEKSITTNEKIIHAELNAYTIKQLADIEYFRTYHNIGLKLSWLMENKKKKQGFDETYFDKAYSNNIHDDMSFVYIKSGKTFEPSRANACPYTTINNEKRILIKKDEDAAGKLLSHVNTKIKHTVRTAEHLDQLVASFEDVFGNKYTQNASSKIDAIIQRVFFN